MEKQVKYCAMEKHMKPNVRYFVPALLKRQKQPFANVIQNGALKNFAMFTGRHLCCSLFLQGCWPEGPSLKRDSNTGVFLSILRNF